MLIVDSTFQNVSGLLRRVSRLCCALAPSRAYLLPIMAASVAAAASAAPPTMAPQLATFIIDTSLTRSEYLKLIAPRGAAESLVKRMLENLRMERESHQGASSSPSQVGVATNRKTSTTVKSKAAAAAAAAAADSATMRPLLSIATIVTACPDPMPASSSGEPPGNAEASSSRRPPFAVPFFSDDLSSFGPLSSPILYHHNFQPYDTFLANLPQLANFFPPAAHQAQGARSSSSSSTAEYWQPFGAGLSARLSRFLANEQGNGESSMMDTGGLLDGLLVASEMVEEYTTARRRRSRITLTRRPREEEDDPEPYLVVMSGRNPRMPGGANGDNADIPSRAVAAGQTTRLLSPSLSPEDSRAKTERGGAATPSSLALPQGDLLAEFSPASAADGFEQHRRHRRSSGHGSCWNRTQRRDDWGWAEVTQELVSQRARLSVVLSVRGSNGDSSALGNLVNRLRCVYGDTETPWWPNATSEYSCDVLGFTKTEPVPPVEPPSATPSMDKNANGKRPIDAANSPLEQDLAMEAKRFKADAEAARAQKLAAAAQFAAKGAIVASAGNMTPHQLNLLQQAQAIQARAQLTSSGDVGAMMANAQQTGTNQQQTPAMQAEMARRAAAEAALAQSQQAPTQQQQQPPSQPSRPSVSVWRGKLASRPTGRNEQGHIIFDPGESTLADGR